MNTAGKALNACREYDRLMLAIARNKKDISDGLDACGRWTDGENGQRYMSDGGEYHLSEAFAPRLVDDDFGPELAYRDEPAILEIIGDCEGCLKAYKAIQERKANRKALGIIKRSIRMIGRTI